MADIAIYTATEVNDMFLLDCLTNLSTEKARTMAGEIINQFRRDQQTLVNGMNYTSGKLVLVVTVEDKQHMFNTTSEWTTVELTDNNDFLHNFVPGDKEALKLKLAECG